MTWRMMKSSAKVILMKSAKKTEYFKSDLKMTRYLSRRRSNLFVKMIRNSKQHQSVKLMTAKSRKRL